MRKHTTTLRAALQGTGLSLGVACVLLLLAGAAGAAPVAQVTATKGRANAGDAALQMRGDLDEGAELETGDDGNCAVLVDEDALMELCGSTKVALTRKDGAADGQRVVKLDQGEIRMVVEPRVVEERIEIHTPAAIATILGTILHVSVDALGVTTITAAANSELMVKSSNPDIDESTRLGSLEQIVVQPNEAPPKETTRMSERAMSGVGGCLIDFHDHALGVDRKTASNEKVDEVVESDSAAATLPGVEAGESQQIDDQVGQLENLPDPKENITPVDSLAEILDPSVFSPFPDCGPLPGRGCM